MRCKIYDFEDNGKFVRENKEIDYITVQVLSGDEVLYIYFKDGTHRKIDSSDTRERDYFDGEYDVCSDQLIKWIEFQFIPSSKMRKSYQRLNFFELRRRQDEC